MLITQATVWNSSAISMEDLSLLALSYRLSLTSESLSRHPSPTPPITCPSWLASGGSSHMYGLEQVVCKNWHTGCPHVESQFNCKVDLHGTGHLRLTVPTKLTYRIPASWLTGYQQAAIQRTVLPVHNSDFDIILLGEQLIFGCELLTSHIIARNQLIAMYDMAVFCGYVPYISILLC